MDQAIRYLHVQQTTFRGKDERNSADEIKAKKKGRGQILNEPSTTSRSSQLFPNYWKRAVRSKSPRLSGSSRSVTQKELDNEKAGREGIKRKQLIQKVHKDSPPYWARRGARKE